MEIDINDNRVEKVRIVEISEEIKVTLETQESLIHDLTQKVSDISNY